jgi:hypothetical protein
MAGTKSLNMVGQLSTRYARSPIIRSLLSLLPFSGPADELMRHRAEEIHQERLLAFLDEVQDGTKDLTTDVIESEDFLHCFFKTTRVALHSRRREKIRMFARMLTAGVESGVIREDSGKYEELLATLDSLSLREFGVSIPQTPSADNNDGVPPAVMRWPLR